jgi:hypothetical protein
MRKDRGEIKRQIIREKVDRVIGEKEEGKVKGWDKKKRMNGSLKCWREGKEGKLKAAL